MHLTLLELFTFNGPIIYSFLGLSAFETLPIFYINIFGPFYTQLRLSKKCRQVVVRDYFKKSLLNKTIDDINLLIGHCYCVI